MSPRQHRLVVICAGWLAGAAVAIAGFATGWDPLATIALSFLAGFLATLAAA